MRGDKVKAEEQAAYTAPKTQRKTPKWPTLQLETWKVRTMSTGLSEDIDAVSDARKTAIIDRELPRLNMDTH